MPNSKLESDMLISNLKLNRVISKTFNKDSSIDDILKFLDDNKYEAYSIRNKSKSSSNSFKYGLSRDEVIYSIGNYDKFSIGESLLEADKDLILQGDIEIDKDFILMATLSDSKGISLREATINPVYNLWSIDLKVSKEPCIYGLKQVIDYVCLHELFNMVVEFTLFNTDVGINSERIIIWELRNY